MPQRLDVYVIWRVLCLSILARQQHLDEGILVVRRLLPDAVIPCDQIGDGTRPDFALDQAAVAQLDRRAGALLAEVLHHPRRLAVVRVLVLQDDAVTEVQLFVAR